MELGLAETGALLNAHFDETETTPHKLRVVSLENPGMGPRTRNQNTRQHAHRTREQSHVVGP